MLAQVCVMSADFWGLKTAGGTATAYHLLAAMLAKSHALEVRLTWNMPYICFKGPIEAGPSVLHSCPCSECKNEDLSWAGEQG